MNRRPRKPKKNNNPRNPSEKLGSELAKLIKRECPCGCTKSQSVALAVCVALGLKLSYEAGKRNKPKNT